MYNVYNKSDVYYLYNCDTATTSLIGNKDDLIKMISKKFNTYDYSDPKRWSNEYFDNINLGNDTYKEYTHYYLKDEEGENITIYNVNIINHKYIFYDGFNRIVDIRDFKDECVKYFIIHKNDPYVFRFKKSKRQNRKYHSGNRYKHKAISNACKVRKLDSMFKFDEEYKEYHFKKIEDSNNPYPIWWDDSCRRVESNWKSQYKTNRQHNIHNKGKNNNSIRKIEYNNFSKDDIEEMLYEDFKKHSD